jgi:hypothetical protein
MTSGKPLSVSPITYHVSRFLPLVATTSTIQDNKFMHILRTLHMLHRVMVLKPQIERQLPHFRSRWLIRPKAVDQVVHIPFPFHLETGRYQQVAPLVN